MDAGMIVMAIGTVQIQEGTSFAQKVLLVNDADITFQTAK